MTISDITPYVGVFAPIVVALTVLDHIVKDEVKKRVFQRIVRIVSIGGHPLSKDFYLASVFTSIFTTFVVVVAGGVFQSLSRQSTSALVAFKSLTPLVLAIGLKIVILDYLLALKSAGAAAYISLSISTVPVEKRPKGIAFRLWLAALVALDLFLSATLTQLLIFIAANFQSLHLSSPAVASPIVPPSVKAFFDELSFVARDAIEKSFYVLNGTLFYYGCVWSARVFERAKGKVDEAQLEKNIFKAIGSAASLVILVSVICYKLAAS